MKHVRILVLALTLVMLLAGCTRAQPAEALPLPDNFALPARTIYSLGEATHGSAEFTLARQNVFAYLVQERGVRAFCLEADFAEGQKINSMLYADSWNAAQTTRQFAFWVYRHQEMANLMQWMRDHNSSAPPEEQVRFYGIDCQHWDDGKALLHAYLQSVESELAEWLMQQPLSDIRDASQKSTAPDTLAAGIARMDALISAMEDARAAFAALRGEREYEIALQAARSMRISLQLEQMGPDREAALRLDLNDADAQELVAQFNAVSNMRDAGMAAHVDWVLAHEKTYYGREAIFVTGHNGHIRKGTDRPEVAQLGALLAERYGEGYYAIGTDFSRGWFKAVSFEGKGLKTFYLENGPLADRFPEEAALTFVDFAATRGFLDSPQRMHRIGAVFDNGMKEAPESYLEEITPSACYDALLYMREVHAFHSSF